LWHQLGNYNFPKKALKVKVGFFNTSSVSAGLMQQYAFRNMQRDWYKAKCSTYKNKAGNETY